MCKVFSAILAAAAAATVLLSAGVVSASEPSGHAFCKKGLKNPQEFAARFSASLEADPSGMSRVEGCLATPRHFLKSFQRNDPEAGLTSLSQLPNYLLSLVAEEAKPDYWFESDILREVADGSVVVAFGEVTRGARRGEVVYRNPTTGKKVMMSDCANPGVIAVPPIVVRSMPCVTVKIPGQQGKAIRFAYIAPAGLPGHCTELSVSGEIETRYEMPDDCPDSYRKILRGRVVSVNCSWDAVETAVSENLGHRSEVQEVSGSFKPVKSGYSVMRLPAQALDGTFAVCFELADGSTITLGVSRGHYVDGVATIPDALVFGK